MISKCRDKCSALILAQLVTESLINKRIHGLRDAYHSGEHDAPRIGAVESAGGGDGDGAEQDGYCKGLESDVSAGDVFLEHLHERGHDQTHESGCERGRGDW